MTDKNNISKNEVSWWKGVIIVIVGVAIWGIKLEATVNAMQSKGVKLREDTEGYMVTIQEDIRIIKNIQIQIAKELNINIEY